MLAQDPNKLWYQKKYEEELLIVLEELVAGVDTRIRRSLARIEATVPDLEKKQANQDKVNSINALIDRKLQEVESLAEAGHINESEALIKEIEALKEAREEQEAMVCEICGAMQSTTDTENRQQSHLKGKQHIGFSTIRECIKQLKAHQEMYQHVDITRPPDLPAQPKVQPFRQPQKPQKKDDLKKKPEKRNNQSRSPRY